MPARISQSRAHDALRAILDPEDRWWWTWHGLILLTDMARAAAGRPQVGEFEFDGGEIRVWLAVHADLTRRFARAARERPQSVASRRPRTPAISRLTRPRAGAHGSRA